MKLLDSLNWRYATKKYDATRKVSEENIDKIKEAIRLSASSYGLQLFKVLDIRSNELREKLLPASWNQPQVTDASHLFVFCGYSDVTNENIDFYLNLKSEVQGIAIEDLQGYGDFMKNTLGQQPAEAKQAWTAKQTYIALSSALAAAGELEIDSTPMEGFDPAAYGEILGLEEKGLQAAVVMAIGYRSDEDQTQHGAKVRKSKADLFEVI